MSSSTNTSSFFWGILLILLGILFILQNMGHLDVGDILSKYWPLILIAIGIKIILDQRKFHKSTSTSHHQFDATDAGTPPGAESAGSNIQSSGTISSRSNLFGDVKLKFDDQTINKFSVNNLFGDIDLDYGKAKFKDASNLHISGVFGDVDICLPQNISVEVRASCIAGDLRIFEERQDGLFKNIHYSSPTSKEDHPIVHINISIVFGDIRVHH